MPTSPAAALETVAAKRRGLAARVPSVGHAPLIRRIGEEAAEGGAEHDAGLGARIPVRHQEPGVGERVAGGRERELRHPLRAQRARAHHLGQRIEAGLADRRRAPSRRP